MLCEVHTVFLSGVVELLERHPAVVILVDLSHDLLDLLHGQLLVRQLQLRLRHVPVSVLGEQREGRQWLKHKVKYGVKSPKFIWAPVHSSILIG